MFDWTGTSDPTAWMCIETSIQFIASLLPGGWPRVREENRRLALQARELLCRALRQPVPAPADLIGSMASVILPPTVDAPASGPDPLYLELARRGFEAVVTYWPSKPKRLLRVSAQLYNTVDEYERLAGALLELL
jgi:isopenicillin-N epimerase